MEIKDINSRDNAFFKILLSLRKTRGIKKHGLAIFSGSKPVTEVLQGFRDHVHSVLLSREDSCPGIEDIGDLRVSRLAPELFRQIDFHGTSSPLLVVKVESFKQWNSGRQTMPGCILCVPFQDPANVGAVVRSAAAFGVSAVVLLEEAAHPYHSKSIRAAGSALFRVPIFKGPSLERAGELGSHLIGLSPGGLDIRKYRFPRVFFLVPGMEGPGLPGNIGTEANLSIPMDGNVESINAALATGIALYAWKSAQI